MRALAFQFSLLGLVLIESSCTSPWQQSAATGGKGGLQPSGGAPGAGGVAGAGESSGGAAIGGSVVGAGTGGDLPVPVPKYYPVPGFESCRHAEVKSDCADGWCRVPASCFVIGSPQGESHRGADDEDQTIVTLTHRLEIQQKEMTRGEWEQITGTPAPGPDNCTESGCPVAKVSWWDAVHAANMLSEQKKLTPCYEPVGCTGTLGVDLVCTGVAEPDKSVYECEGYRLPTRTESEYAARAGTWSTFYSGDIVSYASIATCGPDRALEKIGWYCYNSDLRAHRGCELEPNGFGLCDTIGNLLEWNSEEVAFSSSPGGDNPRGTVGVGQDRSIYRGQYDGSSHLARTAGTSTARWFAHGNQGGFRLVRTLDPNPGQ